MKKFRCLTPPMTIESAPEGDDIVYEFLTEDTVVEVDDMTAELFEEDMDDIFKEVK